MSRPLGPAARELKRIGDDLHFEKVRTKGNVPERNAKDKLIGRVKPQKKTPWKMPGYFTSKNNKHRSAADIRALHKIMDPKPKNP